MMTIRVYAAGDEDAVVALWHACELVVPWNDPATDIRITTSNGGIDLVPPKNYSAKIDASTSNGSIHTALPLEGKKVRLREVRESDLPLLVALRNDLDTQGWSQTLPTDYTLNMYQKSYEEESFSTKRKRARWVIETLDTQEVAGNITYYSYNPPEE